MSFKVDKRIRRRVPFLRRKSVMYVSGGDGTSNHYVESHNDDLSRRFVKGKCNLKILLHYLRGVLGCRWIESHKTLPPWSFSELVAATVEYDDVRTAINSLIEIKKSGTDVVNFGLLSSSKCFMPHLDTPNSQQPS